MVDVEKDEEHNYYNITMDKGDSASFTIRIKNGSSDYTPVSSDKISFSVARTWGCKPVLVKSIPYSTVKLILNPGDTQDLAIRQYRYDIEIVHGGYTYTIIKGRFTLGGEISTTKYPDPTPYMTDTFEDVDHAVLTGTPVTGTILTVFGTYTDSASITTQNRSCKFTVGTAGVGWNGHLTYDGNVTFDTYDSDNGQYTISVIGYNYTS